MSEYQYYEFQALDRPLTKTQMEELRKYSSRAKITPTSFINHYNWGDFKGDPVEWMEKYFDAFYYLANWGTRWFMLKAPEESFNPDEMREYSTSDSMTIYVEADNLIFSFESEEIEDEWIDEEGQLFSLADLRADLMDGDFRCLYLGWLLGVQNHELDDESIEPPVPAGLTNLNEPLQSLSEFLRIDPDLIVSAGEASPDIADNPVSKEWVSDWVARLPEDDKNRILVSIIEGDLSASAKMKQRALKEIRESNQPRQTGEKGTRRTVGQIRMRAEEIAEKRRKITAERKAREKAERKKAEAEKRKKHLDSLMGREEEIWVRIEKLIEKRQPKSYDETVALLTDLRDITAMREQSDEFILKLESLRERHVRKNALIKKIDKAELS